MSDKEKYTCFECAIAGRDVSVELDTNGRCGVCHSDAVLSAHQVATVATQAIPALAAQGIRVERIARSDERKYYWMADGGFETVVSWQDATDTTTAAKYAYEPTHNHPWYRRDLNERVDALFKTQNERTLSHNEYCDWLRSH